MQQTKIPIALVRAPIISQKGAINNEATPAIGLAYLSGYLRKSGYEPVLVDAVGEGINQVWPLKKYPEFRDYCPTLLKYDRNFLKYYDTNNYMIIY